jgi:hypothetical protein
MKKVVWSLGILALTCGMAQAQDVNELVPAPEYQAPASTASTLDKAIIANEHKVMTAVAKGDKAGFSALVAPDAMGLDGMVGLMKASEFASMLDQVKVTNWKITDEKVQWVDANTAILTYKWTGTGTFQGQKFPSPVWCSSVWTKKGDKWLSVFHQETEAVKK